MRHLGSSPNQVQHRTDLCDRNLAKGKNASNAQRRHLAILNHDCATALPTDLLQTCLYAERFPLVASQTHIKCKGISQHTATPLYKINKQTKAPKPKWWYY